MSTVHQSGPLLYYKPACPSVIHRRHQRKCFSLTNFSMTGALLAIMVPNCEACQSSLGTGQPYQCQCSRTFVVVVLFKLKSNDTFSFWVCVRAVKITVVNRNVFTLVLCWDLFIAM